VLDAPSQFPRQQKNKKIKGKGHFGGEWGANPYTKIFKHSNNKPSKRLPTDCLIFFDPRMAEKNPSSRA